MGFFSHADNVESEPRIGLDKIYFQRDDFGDRLTSLFTKIKKIGFEKDYSSNEFLTQPDTRNLIDEIDKITLERTGLKIKHYSTNGGIYAVLVPVMGHNTNFSRYAKQSIDWLRKNESKLKACSGTDADKECVTHALHKGYLDNSRKLQEKLINTGITVDFKNAKITGMEDVEIPVLANFYLLCNSELEPRELTGILLHEIGHPFDSISYSQNTVSVNNTLIDEINNMSGTLEDKIIFLAKELNVDEPDGPNNMINLISIVNSYIDKKHHEILKLNSLDVGSSEFESYSDSFAVRFGYGKELASGLRKISNRTPFAVEYIGFMLTVLFGGLFRLILTFVAIAESIFLPYFIFLTLIFLMYKYLFAAYGTRDGIYEDTYDRIRKLRIDMIRELKSTNLPKTKIKEIIANIEDTENSRDLFDNMNLKFLRLVEWITYNGKEKRIHDTERLFEELMTNDVEVSLAKLKLRL